VIRFEIPELLWLLALLPFFFGAWWWLGRRAQVIANRIVPKPLMPRVAYGQSSGRKWWRTGLWFAAIALLIVAMARPQVGTRMEEVKREGVDVLIAVDISNSMLSEDYAPSRLESAKFSIQRLVNGLKGDRVGLIAFAGTAIYHCPLTTDYGAVKLLNRVMSPGIVPEQGTALADAIDKAKQAFTEQEDSKSKVLVIITDGEDHEEASLDAAREAHDAGITIFTIGMGTPGGAPIPIVDAAGRTAGYKKDENGQIIVSRLNEELLTSLAEAGGGSYARATPGGKELELIWNDINQMEKTEFGTMQFTGFEDRYAYFAFPALLLLLIEFLIGERTGQFAGFELRWGRGRS